MEAKADNALAGGVAWVAGLLTGSIGLPLCVLAVAAIGAMMLAGYLPVRRGGSVLVGCFLVLSADAVARTLSGSTSEPVAIAEISLPPPPSPVATQPDDPYAFVWIKR